MKRYHQELHIMKRRARISREVFGICRRPGKYRKQTLGCGRSGCQLCHGEKFPARVPTKREVQAVQDLHGFGFDSSSELKEYPPFPPGGEGLVAAAAGRPTIDKSHQEV